MSKYILIILSASIFSVFSYFVFCHTIDAPSFDDYDATLVFIKKFFFESDTTGEKLKALFHNHNEHRIVFSRSLAALYYGIFHQLNFSHLVIIQNVFLIGCMLLMLSEMLRNKMPWPAAILLLCVFLMNFSFFQVTFYYWGGIQYYSVIFFSILSLIMLNEANSIGSRNYIMSLTFALMAVFSFGNGVLAMFLGGFLLWVQKKYKLLTIWAGISGVTMFFVLIPKSVTTGDATPLNFEWMARLFFTFLGSFLFINPEPEQLRYINIVICAVVGIAVFIFWIRLFISGYGKVRPLLFTLFSLPVLTALIISISRFTTKSAGGVAPRYMFFSAFIPVMVVLILWERGKIKLRYLNVVAFAAVPLWLISFYNNRLALISYNEEIISGIRTWEKDHTAKLIYFAEAEHYSHVREWALKNKVIADEGENSKTISEGMR